MQYIDGETLKSQLEAKGMSVKAAASLVLQLAEGLSEAHDLGIIHRDLKPENIMINRRGTPVIMDFGLAKFSNINGNAYATQAGTILGSAAYMSPEQASGNVQEIDQRSDIYALGTIFFELLTGELPFAGSTMQILGQKSILDPASPLSLKPKLSRRLAAICHKMIAKHKIDRYQTLTRVIKDLQQTETTDTQLQDVPSIEPHQLMSVVFPDFDASDRNYARIASRQTIKWRRRSGTAFLLLCCVIIFVITSQVPDTNTVTISTDLAKQTRPASVLPARPKRLPAQPPADSTKVDSVIANQLVPAGVEVAGAQKELVPGMKFRWCPAGSFTMGNSNSNQGLEADNDQVQVTFSSGFWLGETEVTQGQWESLMETALWKDQAFVKLGANYAASYVSHQDATSYCERLTERERTSGGLPIGWKYVLPTEAQWEYGCRAGTQTRYSFGDDENRLRDYAWYRENTYRNKEAYAHEVGKKVANAWGLHDMHGNVSEWCGSTLAGSRDQVLGSAGLYRVVRGGSWSTVASRCRSWFPGFGSPSLRSNFVGFRVACVNGGDSG